MAEFLLSCAITLVFIAFVETRDNSDFIAGMLADEARRPLYGALASVFGSLFGFGITAASIILGFSSSPRLRIIHESGQFQTIWQVFFATIRAVAFATVLSILGLLITNSLIVQRIVFYALILAGTLSCFRLARTVWVLEKTIGIVTADR